MVLVSSVLKGPETKIGVLVLANRHRGGIGAVSRNQNATNDEPLDGQGVRAANGSGGQCF